MKLRPLFILLLFVVSTAILTWIYYSATHPRRHEVEIPWRETIADLDACCHRKHVKSTQYDHFAGIADQESRGRWRGFSAPWRSPSGSRNRTAAKPSAS